MRIGFIKDYNPETGIGSVESCGADCLTLRFVTQPHGNWQVGQRVKYREAICATGLVLDTSKVEQHLGQTNPDMDD